ncbi:hypothetical protein [Burkholderia sp. BDU5]|uniref:hypothetical protein n=1 Tax=Burkholderia sp. BDU5 TaxID=1385590 RepID=UPI0012E3F057|nr:hypothetical protein [Burkholderia sp. BDU5]
MRLALSRRSVGALVDRRGVFAHFCQFGHSEHLDRVGRFDYSYYVDHVGHIDQIHIHVNHVHVHVDRFGRLTRFDCFNRAGDSLHRHRSHACFDVIASRPRIPPIMSRATRRLAAMRTAAPSNIHGALALPQTERIASSVTR